MKPLVIISNPTRASFRQRIGVYLDILRLNGINPEVAKLPTGSLARRKMFKQVADFDCVFLQKKGLNSFNAAWLRKYSKKIIYDFDDAIMYNANYPNNSSRKRQKAFKRTVEAADMVIAGNSYLAKHAMKFNKNVEVLPTGLNTKAYRTQAKPKKDDKIRLVWIGSKSTLKYLAEIKPTLEEIGLRFDNVILRIICDDFFNLYNMLVEKHRWSEKTQVLDLVSSDIGLAPLPDDPFARGKCGFKILQYAAAGLPVITTPVGVNSEYVTDGITGYHASNLPQWIDKITELIENANLRKKMGDAGRVYVEKFDINIIGKELCSLLYRVTEKELLAKSKDIRVPAIETRKFSASKKKTVSICIPTYNRKEYLIETLNSILAQTYKDYEIVIVDDGSTDGTEDMIKELGLPVTYYWQENSGESAARNRLLELAKGEYLTFIDSDDLLFPYAVEKLVKIVETHNPDTIAYSSYIKIDETGAEVPRKRQKLPCGNIDVDLFEHIYVHSCGTMCTKRLLQEAGGFDVSLPVCSPYAVWLKLSLKCKFIAVEEPTFKRRRHPGNISNNSFANRKIELDVLEDFYYNGGGKELIPRYRAMKRLSKEGYRAGRCAIKEGLYEQACELLSQSFRLHPNFKSLIYWTKAAMTRRLKQL